MVTRFLIQDTATNLYWYGHYTSGCWGSNIQEAIQFRSRDELFYYFNNHTEDFGDKFCKIVEAIF